MIARGINTAWSMSLRACEARFRQALDRPSETQLLLLRNILEQNRHTAFGSRYGFDRIDSLEAFRAAVPLGDYESHRPCIERIREGEHNVLTAGRVSHLIPTSGSSGPRKLIPHTRALQAQFDAALGPWVRDLFRRFPGAARGRAYWSVSPAIPSDEPSAVPIGFQDDTDYLSPLGRLLVRRILAVPSTVRHLADKDAFWHATALHLLAADDLSLVSVWHPSYLQRLLDEIESRWGALLDQLPRSRAAALRRTKPDALREVWPRLALVSAWAAAAAALPFARLRERLGDIDTQPKGLLASECWTTIPYQGALPLAVTSHVFEFIDDAGRCLGCDALVEGQTYETVVTTAGGLYRYRTGDRVRVTGKLHATPTLAFVGRDRAVSDLCGEKLHEAHVGDCLAELFDATGYRPRDQVLAPADAHAPTRYLLVVAGPSPPPESFADRLDAALCTNPHYALARRLGQLEPARVRWQPQPFRQLGEGGTTALGDVKPTLLVGHDALRAFARSTGEHTPRRVDRARDEGPA
jgi:hypothetical protein